MITRQHTRVETKVLTTAEDMYHALLPLQPGESVPETCYILDYQDGTIPLWQVYLREVDGPLIVLVLINHDALKVASLLEPVKWSARQVMVLPGKILASPPYLVGLEGRGPRPMLCDLVQQARAVAKITAIVPTSKKGQHL